MKKIYTEISPKTSEEAVKALLIKLANIEFENYIIKRKKDSDLDSPTKFNEYKNLSFLIKTIQNEKSYLLLSGLK